MGKRYGMRVGKRVGGVRVSAGRGGVRVGSGKSYGSGRYRARVGVSYSSRGGLGGGASYGTNTARIGTNGHGISAGLTGKTGMVSYGGGYGYRFNHGVAAPKGYQWVSAPSSSAGAVLLTDAQARTYVSPELAAERYYTWMHSPGWDERFSAWLIKPKSRDFWIYTAVIAGLLGGAILVACFQVLVLGQK